MAIGDDFTVAVNGDIRHAANSNHYTVLELHRFLQGLADDAVASGNDLVDITSSTPSERSTDNIITLLGTYNIDDTAAATITKEHLYKFMEKRGTKDKRIQDIIYETCVNRVGDADLKMLFNELYKYYDSKEVAKKN